MVPRILDAARKLEIEYEIRMTEYPGHATEIAREYAEGNQPVRLYSCGGDGTFHEIVQAAAGQSHLSVGCIPCGSGNDFVRNFGHRSSFLDMEDQIQGQEVLLDLIHTPYGLAASICSLGLDAQVAYGIDKWRRVPGCGGSVSYILSAVQEISGPLGQKLKVTLDGQVEEGEFLMIAICNGKAYGGGFFAAPQARLDDGLLDVVLVKKISRLQILPVLGAYRKGKHMDGEQVAKGFQKLLRYRKVRQIQVEALEKEFVLTVDGECSKHKSLDAKIQPEALRVILPRSLYMEWNKTALESRLLTQAGGKNLE